MNWEIGKTYHLEKLTRLLLRLLCFVTFITLGFSFSHIFCLSYISQSPLLSGWCVCKFLFFYFYVFPRNLVRKGIFKVDPKQIKSLIFAFSSFIFHRKVTKRH